MSLGSPLGVLSAADTSTWLRSVRLTTRLRSILTAVLWACVIQAPAYADGLVENFRQPLPSPISRQVRFNLTIENPSSKLLTNQTIWLYAPVKRTATQQLIQLDVNVPYLLQEDELGNQIVQLQFAQFPPYGTKVVSIKADLLMSTTPSESELTRADLFIDEEKYIEKNHTLIQGVARQIKGSRSSDTTSAIYQWVRSNLTYAGYIADELGASFAITNKSGDCTEYAYLAAALARANHLPARTLGGYVLDRNSAPKADEYHNWTEVHVDGAWRLLDAQKETFLTNPERYVATRIISQNVPNAMNFAHRYRVDGDVIVRMN